MIFAWLTPARRRGVEYLDDPAIPPDVRTRAMRDVARSNRLFGGTRSAARAVDTLLRDAPEAIVLDVGAGTGDIAAAIAARHPRATIIALDVSEPLLRVARQHAPLVVCGSALALPLRDGSVDVVLCSQLLHHFEAGDARVVLAEMHRVARRGVVVSDIRRSWLAAAGFWIASTALRFHPVTRHDGVVSVLRGFTTAELRALVRAATGTVPRLRRALFWRLTAIWWKPAVRPPAYT